MVRDIRRVLIIWVVEVLALWLLAQVLPGMRLTTLAAAFWAVGVLGLLNALVRPFILLLTLPITVLSFGLLALALNALMLTLTQLLVPGFSIQSYTTALIAVLGLAAINTAATGLLSLTDDGSFYGGVVRRLARSRSWGGEVGGRGLIVLEIDGLAASTLRLAIEQGYMPTLGRWLRAGTHRVVEWDCGLPAQTSSSQAGILHGSSWDIPAFRWYEKEHHRLIVSGHPRDAAEIERRVSTGTGLLHRGGASLCNLLSGDARRSVLTLSTIQDDALRVHRSTDFYLYFLNPYNFSRAIVLMAREVAVELWEGMSQRLRDVRPRAGRGGSFPLLRGISTVLLRELNVYLLMEYMATGVPVAYGTFVGYDVVAHKAGPCRSDALRVLRGLDREIAALEHASKDAPREYHFVVLSDHGQSQGATFRQRYGLTLEELVWSLLEGDRSILASAGVDEIWAHLSALLTETAHAERLPGRVARTMLRRRIHEGYVEVGPDRARGDSERAEVVVCDSGNLGLIYLTNWQGRLSLETIASAYPGLIEGLASHQGVGWVMARSERHGPLVIGHGGIHHLASNTIEGWDPLAPFGANAADHLRRLDSFPHVGDLVVNSSYDPLTGEVAAFEELVGSHGGLGGPQTAPFLLFPAGWESEEPQLVGSAQIHEVLRSWLNRLQSDAPIRSERVPPGST